MAALICAGVADDPAEVTVAHCVLTHCVRPVGGVQGLAVVSPLPSVEDSPACVQSMARPESITPKPCPKQGAHSARMKITLFT